MDYFSKKGLVCVLKQVAILLSLMLSGEVNSSEAVTKQAEFASPLFEPPAHQWFCQKPLEVWARKGCGRSSVMRPPGDQRGYQCCEYPTQENALL